MQSLQNGATLFTALLLLALSGYQLWLDPPDALGFDANDDRDLNLPRRECYGGDQYNTAIFSASNRINEHTIVSDPHNPDHLVAGANDYNAENLGLATGYAWIGYYFSDDGGETWSHDYLPGFPADPRLPPSVIHGHYGAGDPALAASPSDGKVYMAGIGIFGVPPSSIFVARSDDGGRTFAPEDIAFVAVGTGVGQFHDKEWITVDPHDGTVYVGWTDFIGAATTGQLVVSRSTDQGRTWLTPTVVTEITRVQDIQAVQLAVDSQSRVHVTWLDYEENTLKVAHSTNRGLSFGDPMVIATDVAWANAIPNAQYRTPTLPMLAIDNTGGPYQDRIYLAWHDNRAGNTDILLIYGDNGATEWSEPIRVNTDSGTAHQFFPAPAVAPDGSVFVFFYDRRYDPGDSLLDFSYAVSTDGGRTFPHNERLTTESADAEQQGFIGDYIGAWANERGAYGVWCDARVSENNGDVWFGKLVWDGELEV